MSTVISSAMSHRTPVVLLPFVIGILLGPSCGVAAESSSVSGNSLDAEKGKVVYLASCASCHDSGKNRAPKLRRAKDWKHSGFESFSMMESHARKGFLSMPSKGGRPQLSNEDVANAVFFIKENIGKK